MSSNVVVPEPIATFIANVNAGDETAFLDAFVDGGFVNDWGRKFTGREAIAKWSGKEFIGSKGVLTPTKVTEHGSDVTVVGDWRSNHANGLSKFVFVVEGDKLASMTISEG